MLYDADSFWTLDALGRIGLVLWSLVLAGGALWFFARLTARLRRLLSLGLACVTLWAWLWLSPQAYYLYYLLIFDGLPLQWVIRLPPTPLDVLAHLTFSGPANLSAHASGVLGWLFVGLALRPR